MPSATNVAVSGTGSQIAIVFVSKVTAPLRASAFPSRIVAPVFIPHIKDRFNGERLCIVSPDVGGVVRARAFAKRLDADLAIIDKRREQAGVSDVMNVIGFRFRELPRRGLVHRSRDFH